MAELMSCSKCGKKMSSNLKQCPHCGESRTSTRLCILCGKSVEISVEKIEKFYHDSCFNSHRETIANQTFSCQTCHHTFSYGELDKRKYMKHDCDYNSFKYSEYSEEYEVIKDCLFFGFAMPPSDQVQAHYHHVSGRPSYTFITYTHNRCLEFYKKGEKAENKAKKEARNEPLCWIATATCGESSIEVLTLRTFRDNYLRNIYVGQRFIQIYQYISPSLARLIKKHSRLRSLTRRLIVNPSFEFVKWFNRRQNR